MTPSKREKLTPARRAILECMLKKCGFWHGAFRVVVWYDAKRKLYPARSFAYKTSCWMKDNFELKRRRGARWREQYFTPAGRRAAKELLANDL